MRGATAELQQCWFITGTKFAYEKHTEPREDFFSLRVPLRGLRNDPLTIEAEERIQQYCYLAPGVTNVCIKPNTLTSQSQVQEAQKECFSMKDCQRSVFSLLDR